MKPETLLILVTVLFAASAASALPDKTAHRRRPPVEVGQLSVTSSSVASGLKGTFSADGITVAFEAVRGAMTLEEVRAADPLAPLYEIDAQFVDEEGHTFSSVVGGHTNQDAHWADHHDDDEEEPNTIRRAKEFELARRAAQALGVATLPNEIGYERDALIRLGMSIDNVDITIPPGASVPSSRTGTKVLTGYYSHELRIYWAAVTYWPFCDHSATWSKSRDTRTNTPISQYITSNHGRSANDPSMSFRCRNLYTGRTSSHLHISDQSECETPYGALSGSGTHNCNDDTQMQRDIIAMNAHACFTICGDSAGHCSAPNCL